MWNMFILYNYGKFSVEIINIIVSSFSNEKVVIPYKKK